MTEFDQGARVNEIRHESGSRTEHFRLIRGDGRFTADLRIAGLLHAAFVRSPIGHARLVGVSTQEAHQCPGVEAVFTSGELPALSAQLPSPFEIPGFDTRLQSVLAREEARHAGEAAAVVIGTGAQEARTGATRLELELIPLPAVIDVEKALLPDSPRTYSDAAGNLAGRLTRGFGDVDSAFKQAQRVVSRRFSAARAAGAAMEPRCVVVDPSGSDGYALTVYEGTQAPHAVRRSIAKVLGLADKDVRVVAPDVGGGFGPKGRTYPETVALAAIALAIGRPLRWEASRSEDLLTTFHGRGLVVQADIASDEQGHVLGLRARLIQDCGAYLPTAAVVPLNTAQHLLGPYRIPACRFDLELVYTNKTPISPLRGGGRELGVFVLERMLDHLADALDLDPLEIRARNLLQPEDFPYDTGYPSRAGGTVVYDSGQYPACLETAKALVGYDDLCAAQEVDRQAGIYRGVGISMFLESTGLERERARAELTPGGRVQLMVGSPSTGQGHATSFSQVFAREARLPISLIDYRSGDTHLVDTGIGTFASRMAVIAGNAAAAAGKAFRERLREAASEELEAAAFDIDLAGSVLQVAGAPGRGISLETLAGRLESRGHLAKVAVDEEFAPERPTSFAGGAHAAVVRIDPELRSIEIERYVVVHDCGTILNQAIVDGQIHGGVAHGLGNALGEALLYAEDGSLISDSFLLYPIPRAAWVPKIEVKHLASPSPFNPLGVKGAGEGGTIGALATIARAVEHALAPFDVTCDDLPIRLHDSRLVPHAANRQ